MNAISVVLADREIDLADLLIEEGYAKSRADLARQAILEYAMNRGYIVKKRYK